MFWRLDQSREASYLSNAEASEDASVPSCMDSLCGYRDRKRIAARFSDEYMATESPHLRQQVSGDHQQPDECTRLCEEPRTTGPNIGKARQISGFAPGHLFLWFVA